MYQYLIFLNTSSGHKGKYGHEFLELEFHPDGKLRYANNSNYKNDTMIRKEVHVNDIVMKGLKQMIEKCEIINNDDKLWPLPDRSGRQELEIIMGKEHICFTTSILGSITNVQETRDPEGLSNFYYFIQDLKSLVFSLVSIHFKVKPI